MLNVVNVLLLKKNVKNKKQKKNPKAQKTTQGASSFLFFFYLFLPYLTLLSESKYEFFWSYTLCSWIKKNVLVIMAIIYYIIEILTET